MHQFSFWVLLSALHASPVAAAGKLPRGVGPEFKKYYESKGQFSCITNSAVKLSFDQVNDGTCDCPDGSDEPGTAACAYLDPLSPKQPLAGSSSGSTNAGSALPGFWCKNKGHIGAYLPFSLVNDGVCDYDICCDGSDEYAHKGGVQCPNKCPEIGRDFRKLEKEKKEKMDRAAAQKQSMLDKASVLRKEAETKLVQLKGEITKLEAEKERLQKRKEEVEKEEKGKMYRKSGGAAGKLGVLIGIAKARVDELRATLERVADERDDLRKKITELETILIKFKDEHNPNFNDEGVKSAVKAWENYQGRQADSESDAVLDSDLYTILEQDGETNGVNWQSFEQPEGQDTDILFNLEAYLPPSLRNFIHEKLDTLREWLIRNGILPGNVEPGTESAALKKAREAVETAESEIQTKQSEADQTEADLTKDYGHGDIFRAIQGESISIEAGEYTYELTWFDKTRQNSKKGHGSTTMGSFDRIEWLEADDEERADGKSLGKGPRMVLRYDNGEQCWNGPRRSTLVWVGCAEKEELWRVSELEKCVYQMQVGSPVACGAEPAKDSKSSHDEL